jgi:hypothetical protein
MPRVKPASSFDRRAKVKTYFRPMSQKKSLAKPDDFLGKSNEEKDVVPLSGRREQRA